jgi:hypothetical protein
MRRVALLALLALALPTAALASSITDYQNYGSVKAGTATISGTATSGGSLTYSSRLVAINTTTGNLGTVTVSTGVLVGGSGSFTFTGGTLKIVNSSNATLFSGTFTSGSVTSAGGFTTITGFVGGIAGTVQIALNNSGVISGDTIVTPEPGTLGLLGTGLVGLAGIIRRKVRS